MTVRVAADTDFRRLVEGVANGDDQATSELVHVFQRGVRWFLHRQVGADAEDLTQEVLLDTINAIRAGRLDDPDRLAGYIRAIAHNKVCQTIRQYQTERNRFTDIGRQYWLLSSNPGPDEQVHIKQQRNIAITVLNEMSERDREILARFYVDEQTPEQICRDLNLTETQFRLLKSRAKERFAKLGQRRGKRNRLFLASRTATA